MYTCDWECYRHNKLSNKRLLMQKANLAISVDVEKGNCCGQVCHDQCQGCTNTGRVNTCTCMDKHISQSQRQTQSLRTTSAIVMNQQRLRYSSELVKMLCCNVYYVHRCMETRRDTHLDICNLDQTHNTIATRLKHKHEIEKQLQKSEN